MNLARLGSEEKVLVVSSTDNGFLIVGTCYVPEVDREISVKYHVSSIFDVSMSIEKVWADLCQKEYVAKMEPSKPNINEQMLLLVSKMFEKSVGVEDDQDEPQKSEEE